MMYITTDCVHDVYYDRLLKLEQGGFRASKYDNGGLLKSNEEPEFKLFCDGLLAKSRRKLHNENSNKFNKIPSSIMALERLSGIILAFAFVRFVASC